MLISADRLLGTPVMSLQTGSELARTSREIIDPRNLTIVAYELEGPMLDNSPSLLRINDIREIGSLGIIIDSNEEIILPSDVIKIKEVYELQFGLVDKPVFDDDKRRVGKVIGYTLEAGSFVIQQLRIKRPLLKSFGDTEVLVHRSQIVSVSDHKVIIKSARNKQTATTQPAENLIPFKNPFAKTQQTNSKFTD